MPSLAPTVTMTCSGEYSTAKRSFKYRAMSVRSS